jgi:hypothetical protein
MKSKRQNLIHISDKATRSPPQADRVFKGRRKNDLPFSVKVLYKIQDHIYIYKNINSNKSEFYLLTGKVGLKPNIIERKRNELRL